ncbi:MAG: hypothetical protein H6Q53_2186 [Deltaproteobacteria bacterium]|jgi:hypothetical protein|nr:hypothetical protein [Deltaproteobacteria bacterium]
MKTVVKVFRNSLKPDRNEFITRTLGKVGLFQSNGVKDGELWLVEIVKEQCEGKNTGAFILNPIEKLEINEIRKVTLDECSSKVVDGVCYLTPLDPGSCILKMKMKKALLAEHHAVIVEALVYPGQ